MSDTDLQIERGKGGGLKLGCLLPGCGVILGVPLLLFAGAALWLRISESQARQQVQQRIDRLAAEAVPINNTTTDQWYRENTDATLTADWLEVIGTIESEKFLDSVKGVPIVSSDDTQLILKRNAAVDDNEIDGNASQSEPELTAREFLEQWSSLNDKVFDLASQQLQMEKAGYFPIQFDSLNTLLGNTQSMRSVARLIQLRAQVAILDEDSAKISDSIRALFGASRTIAREPTLVSQLVGIAIESMAVNLLKQSLERDVLVSQDLRQLLPLFLDRTEIDEHWTTAMVGERSMGLAVFDDPQKYASVPGLFRKEKDRLHYLELMDAILSAPTDDIDLFRKRIVECESNFDSLVKSGLMKKTELMITSLLLPAIATSGEAFIRRATQCRIASVAIGIRLHEDEQGDLPDSLIDLKPLGIDSDLLVPLGKQPFGYRRVDSKETMGAAEASAILWGFDPKHDNQTPAEPPPTVEPDPQPPGIVPPTGLPNPVNYEINQLWVWEFYPKG